MTFKLLSSSDKSWLANKSLLPLASKSTFFTLEQLSIWCDLRRIWGVGGCPVKVQLNLNFR